nr:uncharacterized protein LOC103432742 isoform X2 [Malus domestica]
MVACLKKRVGLLSSEREMASFYRSALMARALTLTSLNSLNPAAMASPFASATRTVPCATRSCITVVTRPAGYVTQTVHRVSLLSHVLTFWTLYELRQLG